MPNIGEIKDASELGYTFHTKMIYLACKECGKGRWVQRYHNRDLCRTCSQKHAPHLGRKPNPKFVGIPKLGDIKRERGEHYIWAACPVCGKERWATCRNGKPRGSHCPSCAAKVHPRIGSQRVDKFGYVYIWMPSHPHCDIHHYVKRCRLVLEQKLGYILPSDIDIHHINEVKGDDRPENLIALPHPEHRRIHATGKYKTHCPHGHPYNQENTTYNSKGAKLCLTCRKISNNSTYKRLRELRLASC